MSTRPEEPPLGATGHPPPCDRHEECDCAVNTPSARDRRSRVPSAYDVIGNAEYLLSAGRERQLRAILLHTTALVANSGPSHLPV